MNATVAVPAPTYRLIPSRFPPIAAFESVASADDLAAVMELEGWTNDRLVAERLARLPRDQWVFGVPNGSVVMAAFLHAPPTGARFNGGELGAWYAAWTLPTAIAEVAHHLRREAAFRRLPEMRLQYRAYTARLDGAYVDLRGLGASRRDLYDPVSYAASQVFGEEVRKAGGAGIVYDSVRHAGGVNTVAFRPQGVVDVTQTHHYEITAPIGGRVVARRLGRD
jgi:hypothetical protein